MLPLLACGAGIYLGLHFNVLILLPLSFLGFGAFTVTAGYGSYGNLGAVFLFFVSAQAGYVIGLTGRDAYGQVLARLGLAQSKRI